MRTPLATTQPINDDTGPKATGTEPNQDLESWSSDSEEETSEEASFFGSLRRYFKEKKRRWEGEIQPVYPELKIEPKTYLANERTLLQWFSLVSLVVVGSSVYLSLSNLYSSTFPALIILSGFFFLFYAICLFFYRRYRMSSSEVTQSYGDSFGSIVIVGFVIMYFCFAVWTAFMTVPYTMPSVPMPRTSHIPFTKEFLTWCANENITAGLLGIDVELSRDSVRGNLTFYEEKSFIDFYDSSDCDLSKKGYILMSKRNSKSHFIELTWLSQDNAEVSLLDMDSSSRVLSAENLLNASIRIVPKNEYRYLRSLSFINKELPLALNSIGTVFNSRFVTLPTASTDKDLKTVMDSTIIEHRYGDVQINFGDRDQQGTIPVVLPPVCSPSNSLYDDMPAL